MNSPTVQCVFRGRCPGKELTSSLCDVAQGRAIFSKGSRARGKAKACGVPLLGLSLLALASGCSRGDERVRWSVEFACAADGERAVEVEIGIAPGDCTSIQSSVFEARVDRGTAPSPPAPGSLPSGSYAFYSRAFDGDGQQVASDCARVMLPTGDPVALLLASEGGMCGSALDAGVDGSAGGPDASDASSEGGPQGSDAGGQECVAAEGCWFDRAWGYRSPILLRAAKVDQDQAFFPVLVSHTVPEWALEEYGGHVVWPDGSDFVFTSTDGNTVLHHEVEAYDGRTGKLVVWVEVPALSATANTGLFLYYGHSDTVLVEAASEAWDEGGADHHQAVWHMSEGGFDTVRLDSSRFENHVTPLRFDTGGQQPGMVGQAVWLEGLQSLEAEPDPSLNQREAFTLSAWVYPDALPALDRDLVLLSRAGHYALRLCHEATGVGLAVSYWVGGVAQALCGGGDEVAAQAWTHLAVTFDGQLLRTYVNGEPSQEASTGPLDDAPESTLFLGDAVSRDGGFIGRFDEVRISDVARSAGWLSTSHRNQRAPGEFGAVKDLEVAPAQP